MIMMKHLEQQLSVPIISGVMADGDAVYHFAFVGPVIEKRDPSVDNSFKTT